MEQSATYRSTRKLAEECHEFQERLLKDDRRELVEYLGSFLEKY